MNSSFDEVNAIHMCRSPLKKEGLSKYQQVQKVPFSGFEKLSVPSWNFSGLCQCHYRTIRNACELVKKHRNNKNQMWNLMLAARIHFIETNWKTIFHNFWSTFLYNYNTWQFFRGRKIISNSIRRKLPIARLKFYEVQELTLKLIFIIGIGK